MATKSNRATEGGRPGQARSDAVVTSTPPARFAFVFNVLPLFLAIITSALGVLALMGWVLDLPLLASFGMDRMPMAPSTALLFILFGVAAGWRIRMPLSNRAFRIIKATGWLLALVALLLCVLSGLGIHLEVEHVGVNITDTVDRPLRGHMSLITACCFLLASVSFMTSLSRSAIHPWRVAMSFGIASVLMILDFCFLLSYFFGTALLYGSTFIPPALNTLIAFFVLGLALQLLATRAGEIRGRGWASGERTVWHFLLIFILLAVGIITAGYRYFRHHERVVISAAELQLSAIADLKVGELNQWRKERLGDGGLLFNNAVVSDLIRRILEVPEDADSKRELHCWFEKFVKHISFEEVCLLDFQGVTRMSWPTAGPALPADVVEEASEACRTGQVTLRDFYRTTQDQRIRLAVLVPISDEADGSRPLGTIAMMIDPEKHLYPQIKNYPTTSKTAEIILVRREGNEVIFLNELRFQSNTALNLRAPLDRITMPAVQAALGWEGVMEGVDYRGFPVLAALRTVPASPWAIVVHMNKEEVYGPLRARLWNVVAMIGVLLIAAGAGVVLVWREQLFLFYRREAEAVELLRASEERWQFAVEGTGDGVWDWNIHANEVGYSRRWKAILGFAEDEIASNPDEWAKRVHPEDLPRAMADLQAHLDGHTATYANEHRLRCKDGSWKWILARGLVVSRDAGGKPLRMIGTHSDISVRKQTEVALARTTDLLERTGEMARVGGWELDLETMVVTYSKETARIHEVDFPYVPPKLSQGNEYYPPAAWPIVHAAVQAAIDHGRSYDLEVPFITAKGRHLWARIQGHAVQENGKTVKLHGTFQDVSERRKAAEEHAMLQDQLAQSRKMEAVGLLAGGVAHDFNNLLTGIRNYTQLCIDHIAPEHPIREYLDEITHDTERSADIIRKLLAYARRQTIAPRILNINDAVAGMLNFLRRLIGEDINLTWCPGADLQPVKIDPSQIDQILVNLCINSRDAIAGVGSISLETGMTTIDAAYCARSPEAIPGAHVFLSVSDNGCGMEKETLTRVFEPFFTTKEFGKGTGLGLATVYGIVKQNNGFIDVTSEPGKGATFKIHLPGIADEVVAPIVPGKTDISKGRGETILLVEDEKSLRVTCGLFLRALGYKVLAAETPGEALKMAEQYPDDIHVLLTDVIMPEMNGQQLAQRINAVRPGVKIVFMSGYPTDEVAQNGSLGDGVQFLAKPFTREDLMRKLREVLDFTSAQMM